MGYSIYRIDDQIRRTAPDWVEFVDRYDRADLQILHVVSPRSLHYLVSDCFVLWQHVFAGIRDQPFSTIKWLAWFERAALVVSFLDLPALSNSGQFSFLRTPHGVDGKVFRPAGTRRDFAIMTTGDVRAAEAILECREAVTLNNQRLVHLGRHVGTHPAVRHEFAVSDRDLALLYSQCDYVSGLRRVEGFELPVVEGLACGARPICFDKEHYRHWFEDHAEFVPEVPPHELIPVLAEVLAREPRRVSENERAKILSRFNWRTIYAQFWKTVQRHV